MVLGKFVSERKWEFRASWERVRYFLAELINDKIANLYFWDEGEVWFGEDAMYRMIKHLERLVEEDKIEENDPIIDLGTGNGYEI